MPVSNKKINTSVTATFLSARGEWVIGSGVDKEITISNLKETEDKNYITKLLSWKGYSGTGGWYVLSIDPQTGEETKSGQFKPSKPFEFPDGKKPAKYLSFSDGADEGAIFLAVSINAWEKIAKKYGIKLLDADIDYSRKDYGFWRWVINHSEIPIKITEGVKKAGCLLSNGYVAICLAGVWNGQIGKIKLVPNLELFITKERKINLVFDSDIVSKESVQQALENFGGLCQNAGAEVFVPQWTPGKGKGCDDYIVRYGIEAWESEVMNNKISFQEWRTNLEKLVKKTKDRIPTPRQIGLELAEQHQPTVAFHNEQRSWRVYNGKVWESTDGKVLKQKIFIEIEGRNIEYNDDTYIEKTMKTIENKLLIPKWESFDRTKWIAFDNGVLELETNKLHKHSPGFRFTSHLPRDYTPISPEATDENIVKTLQNHCPVFYKWAMQAMKNDERKVRKLLAIINAVIKFRFYSLQFFIHLFGEPATGKSTFAGLLKNIVGKGNYEGSKLPKLNNDYEIAKIIDKQLVICPDEEKKVGGFGGLLSLTGQDPISYRKIYQEATSGFFYGTVLLTSNVALFAGDTSGIDRRLCLVHFNNPIPAHLRDSKIQEKIEAELSALTSVALLMDDDEVTELIKGIGESEIPEFKAQAWDMKCEKNSMAAFINEEVIYEPGAKLPIGKDSSEPRTELFGAYTQHATKSGARESYKLQSLSGAFLENARSLGWDCSKGRSNQGYFIHNVRLRRPVDYDIPTVDQLLVSESFDSRSTQSTLSSPSKGSGSTLGSTLGVHCVDLPSAGEQPTDDGVTPNEPTQCTPSVDPSVDLKAAQGKESVDCVDLNPKLFTNDEIKEKDRTVLDASNDPETDGGDHSPEEPAPTSEAEEPPLKVGDRVAHTAEGMNNAYHWRGTIKSIDGEWAKVDWDNKKNSPFNYCLKELRRIATN